VPIRMLPPDEVSDEAAKRLIAWCPTVAPIVAIIYLARPGQGSGVFRECPLLS
jgi:hypothetical protein